MAVIRCPLSVLCYSYR
uniref:Uncharacterized protein n=1 Tax=Anguilla anguilla TaxID=7936 RepID=A0A0E9T2Z6_ANGAN